MHELFGQVLSQKDLSKAGELFSVDDKDIEADLSDILEKICAIVDSGNYASSANDQSVVEICITRVTTAIRETASIEIHAKSLVKLLETCNKHDLKPSPKDEDPPHAKIASDIMSCLFMHYSRGNIMELAIPVVVNFLSCGNKELSNNVSSYLSLTAIENADLLAKYMDRIIISIMKGNYTLCRVLPQIFSQNSGPIMNHVHDLVKILDNCETSEKASLLQVFGLIAKQKPKILEPHIPKFCEFLSNSMMAPLVLIMFVDMAVANPSAFVNHVTTLKQHVEQQPNFHIQIIQVIGAVGTIDEIHARQSMEYLISQLLVTDHTTLQVVLNEIRSLCLSNQKLLAQYIGEISKLSQNGASGVRMIVQLLKDDYKKCSVREKETRSVSSQTEGTVTVITVGNPPNAPYPSGMVSVRHTVLPPSNMSSQQSLAKSSRNSASNIRDRPVSPASTFMSDRMSINSAMTTGSNHTTMFPPEPIRDGVQHFCEKHMASIKHFIDNLSARIPLPVKCGVINGRHKRYVRLNFQCSSSGSQCLYAGGYFSLNTKIPKTWIHLMFLALQAKSSSALSQQDSEVVNLKSCWDALRVERGVSGFLTLLTSSFPLARDQDALLQELHGARYFDVFEFNAAQKHWACFMCNHPEKMSELLQDGSPVMAGQLKEKKGRWKFLKRWKTRYFTLSGAHITCAKSDSRKEMLPVSKIQSVKAVRKGIRDIPKAFEIFTEDQTYVFKAKGRQNIEQWVQCLHIAVSRAQRRDTEPDIREAIIPIRPRSSMFDTKL